MSQIVLPTGSLLRDTNPAVLATRAGFCQRRAKLKVTLVPSTATRGEDAGTEGELATLPSTRPSVATATASLLTRQAAMDVKQ